MWIDSRRNESQDVGGADAVGGSDVAATTSVKETNGSGPLVPGVHPACFLVGVGRGDGVGIERTWGEGKAGRGDNARHAENEELDDEQSKDDSDSDEDQADEREVVDERKEGFGGVKGKGNASSPR